MYFRGPSAVIVNLDDSVANGDAHTILQWQKALYDFRRRSKQQQENDAQGSASTTVSATCGTCTITVTDGENVTGCSPTKKRMSGKCTPNARARRSSALHRARRTSCLGNGSSNCNNNFNNSNNNKNTVNDEDTQSPKSGVVRDGDAHSPHSDVTASTAPPSRRRKQSLVLDDFFHISHELEMLNQALCKVTTAPARGGRATAPADGRASSDTTPHATRQGTKPAHPGDAGRTDKKPPPTAAAVDEVVLCPDADSGAASRARCDEAAHLFRTGAVREALAVYTQLSQDASIGRQSAAVVNNIAVCYFRLEEWPSCLRATRRALDMDPTLTVARRRLVRVHLALNQRTEAKAVLASLPTRSAAREAACVQAYEQYVNLYDIRQYELAKKALEELLRLFPCATWETHKVQLLSLESMAEARMYAEVQIARYPACASLRYWKAELQFQLAGSVSELQEVLAELEAMTTTRPSSVSLEEPRMRLVLTRVRACLNVMTETERLLGRSAWHDVIAYGTAQLNVNVAPGRATAAGVGQSSASKALLGEGARGFLYTARAQAYVHTGQWYRGLDDVHHAHRCQAAVSSATGGAASSRTQATLLLLTALSEEGLHRVKDAVHHAWQSLQLYFTPEATQLLSRLEDQQRAETRRNQQQQRQEQGQGQQTSGGPRRRGGEPFVRARREKQQQKQEDAHSTLRPLDARARERCFGVLALPVSADERTVRQTYRALAMRWHPDRWCGASNEETAHAELKFKEVQNAYEVVMGTFDLV